MFDLLLDPMFRLPLAVGFLATLQLSLLGCYLRVREEWLAVLGLAHIAGAAGLAGSALHWDHSTAALAGAIAAVLSKQLMQRSGNTGYVLLMLAGWAILLLVAANTSVGEAMGHAMMDGQLYFADHHHMLIWGGLTLVTLPALYGLSSRLLRARLLPGYEAANHLPAWQWHFVFDALAAASLSAATASMGLMAAFALTFIPAWLAFSLARGWRWTLLLAGTSALLVYTGTFALALRYDQPFGPVLVALLVLIAVLTTLPQRWHPKE